MKIYTYTLIGLLNLAVAIFIWYNHTTYGSGLFWEANLFIKCAVIFLYLLIAACYLLLDYLFIKAIRKQ